MSFMDEIGKLSGMLGGADPQEAAQAASDHVGSMDSNELAGHLQQSLGTMDQGSLMGLGTHLLQAFTQRGGSGDAAAADAGTDSGAVASGDTGAIGSLINMAKSNPGLLQSAASSFLGNNPNAISQLAPGLLSGIMGRLGR